MIVTIGGMYRSGSTFTFNVVREILCEMGSTFTIPDNSLENALKLAVDSEHLIIKSHAPDQLITSLIAKKAILCICTYRKPEDAIASWLRVFGGTLDATITITKSWLEWHSKAFNTTLNIPYDLIEQDPLNAIYKIQQYLTGLENVDKASVLTEKYQKTALKEKFDLLQQTENTTDLGFTYYDKETFFHRRHISSVKSISALEEFSQNEIAYIRDQLNEFVDIDGNYELRNRIS